MAEQGSILLDSTEEVEDAKSFREITLKEKIFNYKQDKDGFEETIKIKLPNLRQKDIAEAMYSKEFNKLLQDPDHLTTRQLLDLGKKRGMWAEEQETRLADIDTEILESKSLLKLEKNKKKQKELEERLDGLRTEKFRLAITLGQLTSTGIETIAEKARYEYLIVKCIFVLDEDGKETHLYKSKSELSDEWNLEKLEKILLDARSFWSGEGLLDFLHLDG